MLTIGIANEVENYVIKQDIILFFLLKLPPPQGSTNEVS